VLEKASTPFFVCLLYNIPGAIAAEAAEMAARVVELERRCAQLQVCAHRFWSKTQLKHVIFNLEASVCAGL